MDPRGFSLQKTFTEPQYISAELAISAAPGFLFHGNCGRCQLQLAHTLFPEHWIFEALLAYFSKFQEYQHAGKSVFIEWETKTSFVLVRKTSAINVSEVNNAISWYVSRTDAGAATSLHTTTTLAACTMGQGTFLARTTGSFPFKRCT